MATNIFIVRDFKKSKRNKKTETIQIETTLDRDNLEKSMIGHNMGFTHIVDVRVASDFLKSQVKRIIKASLFDELMFLQGIKLYNKKYHG